MSAKKDVFLNSKNYSTDCCAREAKDAQNEQLENWRLYRNFYVPCDTPNVRSPEFQYDHTNLRASIGYGVADGCVIDQDSKLRNNASGITHDRCKVQLFQRVFQACPTLKPTLAEGVDELPILEGISTTTTSTTCKKQIMERDLSHRTPLVACMQDIQNPIHIVPTWTRGGDPTRDFVRRKEFMNLCGYGMKTLH